MDPDGLEEAANKRKIFEPPPDGEEQFDAILAEGRTAGGKFILELVNKGGYQVDTTLKFFPDKNSKDVCPQGGEIDFIQTIRIKYLGDNEPIISRRVPTLADGPETTEDKRKGIEPGWRIDSPLKAKSIYYNDGVVNEFKGERGKSDVWADGEVSPAVLRDRPGAGERVYRELRFEAETAAVCRQNGKVLGVIRWGFDVLLDDERKRYVRRHDVAFLDRPSASFFEAQRIYENQANP